ncbi:glycerophosphodiester phosphodiesterase [Arthrobacter zhaoxinii]|uniref:glycerophosphodiester phosphodiesterase n=1 Tax=Arthrobacter zhaoxinii TaxID=2964616 RepID=UPI00210644D6|nr:glycerophosphodiester phosphodiesterase [Arthrobacter zhaoxinii]MCQ1999435.1 glycerophosphodiester phosphodiesterase [Arthrobacter zhaoxinii]
MIAHRGHSTAALENTLPAFAAAAAAGAALIETDIRLTADGTAVLLHGADLRRTTNLRGRVDRTPSAREGGPHSVRAACRSGRRRPVLRKPQGCAGSETRGQAFSPRTVAALALAAPGFRRGLLVGSPSAGRHGEAALQRFLFRVEAAACNPGGRFLPQRPDLLHRLRADGLAVFPWTLDRPVQWIEAPEAGADGIITNRPGALAAWGNTRNANWTAGAI